MRLPRFGCLSGFRHSATLGDPTTARIRGRNRGCGRHAWTEHPLAKPLCGRLVAYLPDDVDAQFPAEFPRPWLRPEKFRLRGCWRIIAVLEGALACLCAIRSAHSCRRDRSLWVPLEILISPKIGHAGQQFLEAATRWAAEGLAEDRFQLCIGRAAMSGSGGKKCFSHSGVDVVENERSSHFLPPLMLLIVTLAKAARGRICQLADIPMPLSGYWFSRVVVG